MNWPSLACHRCLSCNLLLCTYVLVCVSLFLYVLFKLIAFRLTNYTIGLTNVSPESQAPIPGEYDMCHLHSEGTPTEQLIKCDSVTIGRYLIIQLLGKNSLTICELEVYTIPCESLHYCQANRRTRFRTLWLLNRTFETIIILDLEVVIQPLAVRPFNKSFISYSILKTSYI